MTRTAVLIGLTAALVAGAYAQDSQQAAADSDWLSAIDPAVVTVRGPGFDGAGFVVDDAGHILSAAHVVRRSRRVEVKLSSSVISAGLVIARDDGRDLCLIECAAAPPTPLRLAASAATRAGQDVFAIGAPMGLDHTLTKGIVSAVRRRVGGREFVQIDAALNPGNSGGPVVDERGGVIGMSTTVVKDAQNLGFAVPSEVLAGFLQENQIPYQVAPGEALVPLIAVGSREQAPEPVTPEGRPVSLPLVIGIVVIVSILTSGATSLLLMHYVLRGRGVQAPVKTAARAETQQGDDLSDVDITLH